ncbi:MAG: hypothetical protein H6683_07985 [Deltaproteobacteria bacterium]|nr:hypothetical protein [Deltaproteobacteria bacterium]
MNQRLQYIAAGVLVAAVIAVQVATNIWWTHRHTAYDGISEGDLVAKALEYADFVDAHPYTKEQLRYLTAREQPTDTPRLLFALGYEFMEHFGRGQNALYYAMTLVFAVLLLGTFVLGARTVGLWPAVFATALVGLLPQVYDWCRAFTTYPAATALLCFALVFLIESQGFMRPLATAAFFVTVILMLLVERGTPPIFLAGPVAFALWPRVRDLRERRPMRLFWVHLALGVAATLLVAGPYLMGYVTGGAAHIGERVTERWFQPGDYWYGKSFVGHYYLVELAKKQAGPPVAWAFYLSLIAVWRRPFRGRGVIVAAMAVPLVVFTLISTKDTTYVMAWLPLVCLVIGHGVASLPGGWFARTGAALALLAVAGFSFVNYTAGKDWIIQTQINEHNPVLGLTRFLTNWNGRYQPRKPDPDWRLEQVADEIVAHLDPDGRNYLYLRYQPGGKDPQMDLGFAVAYRRPDVGLIVRFEPAPEGINPDTVDVTILRVDDWVKAGCAEADGRIEAAFLKWGENVRFLEYFDEELPTLDAFMHDAHQTLVGEGNLHPELYERVYDYRIFDAWPGACPEPDGAAPNGAAPNGAAPNGTAPNGTAPNETEPIETEPRP